MSRPQTFWGSLSFSVPAPLAQTTGTEDINPGEQKEDDKQGKLVCRKKERKNGGKTDKETEVHNSLALEGRVHPRSTVLVPRHAPSYSQSLQGPAVLPAF